jgi:outer membrane protein OmpA-like peptidoglycan-associated protein
MNRLGRRYECAGLTLTMGLLIGCGSTKVAAPKELVDARAAYNRVANGPAGRYDAMGVRVAGASLDRAEQWNAEDPKAPETRTQAYLALRRAQMAEARGEDFLLRAQREQMEQALLKAQTQALVATSAELERMRAALEEARRRNGSAADERAMAALEAQAGARREARGEVVTLPGALLFATDKSELSPAARARLDVVAMALKSAPDRVVLVEGYTDSTGTDAVNQPLSEARARAVRAYLISRGVSQAAISVRGFGASLPIATNASVEGRATNRRVEIVVPTGAAERMPAQPVNKP